MSEPDLHSKILNSPSFLSLASEQRILATLHSLGWPAIHSGFYTDDKTGKAREIDVLGKRVWERKLKAGSVIADLNLIVEAKSAKGYHLLFSPLEGSAAFRQVHELWLGYEGEERQRIVDAIANSGLDAEQADFVVKKLNKMAYPRGGSRISLLNIDAHPAEIYASAFRETNVGSEKDLDSSVLWKASLSLASVVSSLKQRMMNFAIESLREEVELALPLKIDPVAAVIESLGLFFGRVELYHPVVVIDAPLWLVREGKLSSLKWCRFQQLEMTGYSDWWFDVVNSEHFQEFARELTQYYEGRFKRAKARPSEFSSSIFIRYQHVTEREKSLDAAKRQIRATMERAATEKGGDKDRKPGRRAKGR